MRARAGAVIGALALVASAHLTAVADRTIPPDEERFLNAPLPNVRLTTAAGARTDVSSVAGGRPLLLALVFTRCAGVCSPFLASWRDADRWLSKTAAVSRLVVSFDPRDTAPDMAELARHLDLADDSTWTFAVAAPEDVRRLADAVGFWYDWDPSRGQFDHPAMLAAARHGRVVRLLVGTTVTSARVDALVREASGQFVPSYPLADRARFRCVQYDPRTGRLSLDWGSALLFIPVGAIGIMTAVMFSAGAALRRTNRETGPDHHDDRAILSGADLPSLPTSSR
jgi:cytochrome oxidase Cu insertion factor (SCO1/SenC/PrrC family)